MSNDERSESLAQQAASWVPPWERQQRPPDRAYQAEAKAEARATAGDASDEVEEQPDDEEVRSEAGFSDDDDYDEAFEGTNPPGYWSPGSSEAPDETGQDDVDAGHVDEGDADADEGDADEDETGEDETGEDETGEGDADEGDTDDGNADEDETDEGDAYAGEPEEAALSGAADEEPVSVDQPLEVAGEEPEPSAGEIGPELPLPEAFEEADESEGEDEPPVDAPLPVDGDDAGDVFDQAADDDVSDDGVDDLPFGDGDDASGDDPDEEQAVAAGAVAAGAVVAGEVSGDPSSTRPAAGDAAGRGRAANAVPEQGGRRKDSAAAVEDAGSRTDNDLPELVDDGELSAALEAILLVVDEPVAEMQLAQILEQPTERVAAMLEDISARYTAAGHGFDLRRAAGGWRLYTRPEYAAYVERFVLDGQSVRLTQAALETLAVVAYKQPVTRSRISAIRGVNCDGVMRTLVTRGLIEECGIEGETGAHLYRTTPLFLEKLGLNSVDQLPPLAPFLPDDVEEVLDAPG